jgi:coproporphyrinogen III oxidase
VSDDEITEKSAAPTWFRGLQSRIRTALENVEGGPMLRDEWKKDPGSPLLGEGETDVFEGGRVFERAGVMFSHVTGNALPSSATARKPELAGKPFAATGVSLVIHPANPYVPTSHMNVRMLTVTTTNGHGDKPIRWFGGGFDLTPFYPVDEDVFHWHQVAERACGPRYPAFKARCDEYFFLKHRNETRGVGGIFFDDLDDSDAFDLTKRVGDAFIDAYIPIVERRRLTPFTDRERQFQLYRRGRYVEFNLVFDRGTHFGLQSGGRTESILASMPPLASWKYNYAPVAGSPEARLADYLKPRDWLRELSATSK